MNQKKVLWDFHLYLAPKQLIQHTTDNEMLNMEEMTYIGILLQAQILCCKSYCRDMGAGKWNAYIMYKSHMTGCGSEIAKEDFLTSK